MIMGTIELRGHWARAALMTSIALWLAACSGNVSVSSPGSATSSVTEGSVTGTVTGLAGSGLILENNGGDDLKVPGAGPFTFATTLVPGDSYNITVLTQPIAPNQTCTVTNGSGTLAPGGSANVSVQCVNKTTPTDIIGGTVSGLLGSGLVLQNNAGDSLAVSANGPFTFATPMASGAAYLVSVLSPPVSPYQDCAVAHGAGTAGNSDVLDVAITCKSNPNPAFIVSGSVTGIAAGSTLVLQNNGRDTLPLTANGVFHFVTPIPTGSTYQVTSSATGEQSQACTITNASGTVAGANVTNVTAVCTPNIILTAAVSGLAPGAALVLQNNGGDNVTVFQNTIIAFPTAVASGTSYNVTVLSQPSYFSATQKCSVNNAKGTAGAASAAPVTVVCPTLTAIEVTPAKPSVANGVKLQFAATGIYSDNTTQNLTPLLTWSSSNPGVASVSNVGGSNGLANGTGVGTTTITASNGTLSGSATLKVTGATLVSIGVTPAAPSIPNGLTLPFTATGSYSDHTTQNITDQVTWSSSNQGIATISHLGVATGTAAGTATITATSANVAGSVQLQVTNAVLQSIQLTPPAPSIPNGLTQQFTATGTFSDHTVQDVTNTVAWSSAGTDPQTGAPIASISNAGLATGIALGTAVITATSRGISGNMTLTVTPATLVSIQVTPPAPMIHNGLTQQFVATGTFSDHTTQVLTQVVWSSSNQAIATISNAAGTNGVATALAIGATSIAAASGSISGNARLTVTNGILQSITVAPTTPSIPDGLTQQFTATGTYSDHTTQNLTTQVTWSSAGTDPATGLPIAPISNSAGSNGLATGNFVGTAIIAAAFGNFNANTTLTVTPAILQSIAVTPAAPSTPKGTSGRFTATGTYSDLTTQLLTTQVSWSSSNINAATVSNSFENKGEAFGVGVGTSTITATLVTTRGPISGSTMLTVTAASLRSIAVTPATTAQLSLPLGFTQQFTALGTYSDATTQDLTAKVAWSSTGTDPNNRPVMNISNAAGSIGLAMANAIGTAIITAAITPPRGTLLTDSSSVAVMTAVLESITVSPSNPTVGFSSSQAFTALGTFSDGSTLDITTSVAWTSSDDTVASFDGTTAYTTGTPPTTPLTTTITATDPATRNFGRTVLTVPVPTLTAIMVTPVGPTVLCPPPFSPSTQQYTAMGSYSGYVATFDITSQVTWAVGSDPNTQAPNATITTLGLATATVPGTTQITAVSGSQSGAATLSVSSCIG